MTNIIRIVIVLLTFLLLCVPLLAGAAGAVIPLLLYLVLVCRPFARADTCAPLPQRLQLFGFAVAGRGAMLVLVVEVFAVLVML